MAFGSARHLPVPLLIGYNHDEWTTLGHYSTATSLEGLRESLRQAHGENADTALSLYPATSGSEAAAMMASWQTDFWFACPSRFIADRVADAQGEVFFYVFTRSAPVAGGESLGAYHGAETAYVTDNLHLETWVPRDEVDQRLADQMSDYWVRFAHDGDPNGKGLPDWPRYRLPGRDFLELGDRIRAGADFRSEYCDLWDDTLTSQHRP